MKNKISKKYSQRMHIIELLVGAIIVSLPAITADLTVA